MLALDTVIMVHGAGGGGWEYRYWGPIFQKAGYRVVARDLLPARGGLVKTTADDYLRQIAAWTPRRHGRLILVGASMGGPLALAAATRLKADAVILINPVPEIGMPGRKPSPKVVRWANGPYKDTVDSMPESDEQTRRYAWRHWRDESGTVLNRLAKGLNPHRPPCPILLLISGKDTDIAPSLSKATARRLRADVKTLPEMSHVGPLLGRDAPKIATFAVKWLSSEPLSPPGERGRGEGQNHPTRQKSLSSPSEYHALVAAYYSVPSSQACAAGASGSPGGAGLKLRERNLYGHQGMVPRKESERSVKISSSFEEQR